MRQCGQWKRSAATGWFIIAALATGALAGCAGRALAPDGDAPAARLAAAERAADAPSAAPLLQARAGFLRYLIASDSKGAQERFLRAAAAGGDGSEAAALALAGEAEIAEDRLSPEAPMLWARALEMVPRDSALPLAELCALRLLDAQGDSTATDDRILAAQAKSDQSARAGRGLPARAARLLREAAARIEGDRATDAAGVARESEAWRAEGAIQRWRVAGPYAALRLIDLAQPLALDGLAAQKAPALGPAGSTAERTLEFLDGDVELDDEPSDGDVFYAASEVTLARGGDYLALVEGAAALELRIDGAVAVARTPWPREMPRAQEAAVKLTKGTHSILVRWSRAEGAQFRVTLARTDGASSDAASVAPAQLYGARTGGPCGLSQSCVGSPQWADDGGLRGFATRALERDSGDPLAALFLVRATFAFDRPAARIAVERLVSATAAGAPALMLRQLFVQRDPDVPDRIGRSQALADLAEAERKDPLLVRGHLAAAALQRESERYDEAGQELDRAEQALRILAAPAAANALPKSGEDFEKTQEPLPDRLVLAQARLLDAQGNAAKALALVRAVLVRLASAGDDRCDARRLALDLARREGGLDEQLRLAESMQRCEGGRTTLAFMLRDRGELSRAQELFALAAEEQPAQPGRLEQLADVQIAQRRFPEAEQTLRAASALAPRAAEPLRRLAGIFDLAGDKAAATASRAEALLRAPGDLQLRRQLAASRDEKLMAWSDRDGRAISRRPTPALKAGEDQPSAVLLLDQGAVQLFADGGAVERVHSVTRVFDKRGITRHGEVQLPADAALLQLRTLKKDGRVLEPESIPEKEGVSLPGLEPGDAVELDYLRGIAPRGPALPGFTLSAFFFRDDETPLVESSYEARAPESTPFEVDAHNLTEAPRLTHEGGELRFAHTAREVRPAQPEPSAPGESETMPWVQVGAGATELPLYSSIADWALLRARPSAPIDALARGAGGTGSRQTAQQIYAAVAQAVRGKSTGSDFSAAAAQVLAQGRGNRLLVLRAALASAGIASRIALVRPFGADPARYRFPRGDLFSYAVLRIDLAEGPVWADPALRLAPFGHLPAWARGQLAWILPEPGEAPVQVRTPDEPAAVDGSSIAFNLRLAPDGTASGTGRDVHRGFDAASLKATLERIDVDQRKQAVESMLGRALRGVSLDKLSTEGEGVVGGDAALDFALHGALAHRDGDELRVPASPFPTGLQRRWVQKAERALPLLLDQPEQIEATTTIELPPGMHLRAIEIPVALATPFGNYAWEAQEQEGKLLVHETLSIPQQRIAPSRYPAFVAFARAVDETQEQELRIGPTPAPPGSP